MNNIQVFNNPEFGNIRTVEIGGKPYFVGADVAKALGYVKPNNAVSTHCRSTLKQGIATKQGNMSEMVLIPEGDIYRLIIRSKLPSAERFERWVFDEVLPAIRKHGMYATDGVVDKILNSPEFGIELLTRYKEERDRNKSLTNENKFLSDQILSQKEVIAELQPKADYVDHILQSTSSVKTTQIAKDYGMSARAFNKLLYELGIQYKVGDQWVLYARYQACGHVRSVTYEYKHRDGRLDVKMCTEWTQKGRLFLYEILKKEGYLPLMEAA